MNKKALEITVGEMLASKQLTLSLAESCTGGLVGHRLTEIPGSSAFFRGGIVAYAYDAKERLLGVKHDTLYRHGAVSPKTALEMARGARHALGTDLGLSVTGIAGPSGGTPDKPVGLTYIALSAREDERWEEHVWGGNRSENKLLSAEAALELLLRYLSNAHQNEEEK